MQIITQKMKPKHEVESFILIRPFQDVIRIGETILFKEYGSFQEHSKAKLVAKRKIIRAELTNELTYLNNDCDVETHNKIDALHLNEAKGEFITPNDLLEVLTFSSIVKYNPIKK